MHAEIIVNGVVQGVGFRPFIYRTATENGLCGYVQNRGDAGVKIEVEGSKGAISKFLEDIKEKKPPLVKIYTLSVIYQLDLRKFDRFEIIGSSRISEKPGSVIPADVSICNQCTSELGTSRARRFGYFYTTCTNCGPRFSTIMEVPYDRPNTTLSEFPMCSKCRLEYVNPGDRRFHAQTIACRNCGPRVFLTTSDGVEIKCKNPIREASRLIDEGWILAVKGNGGFHIATSTIKTDTILRLRKVKHRKEKPFAVMARSLDMTRSFANVSPEEEILLTSYVRPIVLLEKNENYYLSDAISPQLHNIGVMLPYTGLHILMFDRSKVPAFLMTSANPPTEPIVKDNREALRKMGEDVDYFLLHDCKIAHRCDDSVVRFVEGKPSIIRRSRGYAPEPIQLTSSSKECILALGGELNVTSCILLGDKAYISQHIGDVDQLASFNFLQEATGHLLGLLKAKVDIVACDLHPRFQTTRLAIEMKRNRRLDVYQIQHHHSHIGSLMGEHNLDEIIGVACDGVGYGEDGNIWGGEILHCSSENYKRIGHLEPQPLIGGDLATRYPVRMVMGMLKDRAEAERWLLSHSHTLPYAKKEAEVIIKQLSQRKFLWTTSCGRVLDAIAAILGLCFERTYEGEPAMKLESLARRGKKVFKIRPQIEHYILNTSVLVEEVLSNLEHYSMADLACSAHSYLAEGLAEIAIDQALDIGVGTIGFSGGVAYNEIICRILRNKVERTGLKFVTNVAVPPGDGGLSFGQVIIASQLLSKV